jgi:TetR/AcrR family transcriptional regulator, acrAB operon repressor
MMDTSPSARPEARPAVPAERKRRIDEIGEESRRRILDAAEELFAERGFERTSFVDIAERSGISRGSIPWHFANKDGLLLAAVERALARRTIESKSVEHGDIGEVLEDIKQWMHHPTASMLYTLLTEALSSEGGVHERFVDFHRRGRANLAALIEASGTDQTTVDADVLASLVNGALIGLHLQWKLDQRVDLDAGLDLLARLIKRALPTDEDRAGEPAHRGRRASRRSRTP